MKAYIKAIEYHFPESRLTNSMLAQLYPEWSVEKIYEKTGIAARYVASPDVCSSDLGVMAAEKLFDSGLCLRPDVDYLLFCTQTPDYLLPTTACLIQDRLGLPRSIGAMDFNLGCSGYIYGLGVAKGLIETGQVANVLLITAETYTKLLDPEDKAVRTIFGDAAAATLVSCRDADEELIGPFVYGTDGSGARHLIVARGGMRHRHAPGASPDIGGSEDVQSSFLQMEGSAIFSFALDVVPGLVRSLLEKSEMVMEMIDLFVFHQASRFILDHLRRKLKISQDKFLVSIETCGNTVSSTIPIALKDAERTGRLKCGSVVMLVGFGVGLSWGAAIVRWG